MWSESTIWVPGESSTSPVDVGDFTLDLCTTGGGYTAPALPLEGIHHPLLVISLKASRWRTDRQCRAPLNKDGSSRTEQRQTGFQLRTVGPSEMTHSRSHPQHTTLRTMITDQFTNFVIRKFLPPHRLLKHGTDTELEKHAKWTPDKQAYFRALRPHLEWAQSSYEYGTALFLVPRIASGRAEYWK
jgi:hypothetical protein